MGLKSQLSIPLPGWELWLEYKPGTLVTKLTGHMGNRYKVQVGDTAYALEGDLYHGSKNADDWRLVKWRVFHH